jgi:toxin ParE1/3/4
MTWNANQATRYVCPIRSRLEMLAENPGMGRSCDAVSAGLHRDEHGKHVIFYRIKPGENRIVGVLHQQVIPLKSHFES